VTEQLGSERSTRSILAEIHAERLRQDAKWGEQNHPTVIRDGLLGDCDHDYYATIADDWKGRNAYRVRRRNEQGYPRDRNCAWDGILREEVYEALAEADPVKRRAELVQVAAVAVNMIEQIDRQVVRRESS
jgi:hypothetical protein